MHDAIYQWGGIAVISLLPSMSWWDNIALREQYAKQQQEHAAEKNALLSRRILLKVHLSTLQLTSDKDEAGLDQSTNSAETSAELGDHDR